MTAYDEGVAHLLGDYVAYCTATGTTTQTVIAVPSGRLAPLPADPTSEEPVPCPVSKSTTHSCVGPTEHGGSHLCPCGWSWR